MYIKSIIKNSKDDYIRAVFVNVCQTVLALKRLPNLFETNLSTSPQQNHIFKCKDIIPVHVM